VTRDEWLAALAVRWDVADDGTVTPWEPDIATMTAALRAAREVADRAAPLREAGRRAELLRTEAARRTATVWPSPSTT